MKPILCIVIGAAIAIGCTVKLFSMPLFTSPHINQWWLYGAILGGIIAAIGIYDLKSDDK